ncbi:phosphopantetheine-binding protein [Streptomyces sp. NPDC007984]|uniref:acyl carrier protein n=1 Tax=Streptomyces sp. NPDC007984 TaxID=3364801 RepID=UPI0036E15E41
MSSTKTTYSQVYDVLLEVGLEPSEITSEAALRADLGVDSAELVEIVTRLAPGSKVDGKVLKSVVTVADLVVFLDNLA